jgi:hypothetical protein
MIISVLTGRAGCGPVAGHFWRRRSGGFDLDQAAFRDELVAALPQSKPG